MRKRDDDLVFPNAAGIDVGGSSHWVAVPRHASDDPVRELGPMTGDLNAMADWLIACGLDTVALESTGVCDAKLQALLGELGQRKVDLGKAPRAGSKSRTEFDARQTLANWAGVDLTRINGLGLAAVMKILSEIGPDLSRFETVKHFCSWLGLCPGTKISGGKVLSAKSKRSANWVRQALKMAAMSLSHSSSALGTFYRRLCTRMDKPRANTAVAHKLARMVYFMLTRGEAFVDKGQQDYEEQQRQRSIAALKRRAAALGFEINPTAAPA